MKNQKKKRQREVQREISLFCIFFCILDKSIREKSGKYFGFEEYRFEPRCCDQPKIEGSGDDAFNILNTLNILQGNRGSEDRRPHSQSQKVTTESHEIFLCYARDELTHKHAMYKC